MSSGDEGCDKAGRRFHRRNNSGQRETLSGQRRAPRHRYAEMTYRTDFCVSSFVQIPPFSLFSMSQLSVAASPDQRPHPSPRLIKASKGACAYRTVSMTRTRGRVRSMVLGGRGPDLGVLPRVARSGASPRRHVKLTWQRGGAGKAEPRGIGQPPTAHQEVSRLTE